MTASQMSAAVITVSLSIGEGHLSPHLWAAYNKFDVQGETMSKDQKKTNYLNVEMVENLKTVSRIILESESMIEFWHMEKVWPINLVMDGLSKCVSILNSCIFLNANTDDKTCKI